MKPYFRFILDMGVETVGNGTKIIASNIEKAQHVYEFPIIPNPLSDSTNIVQTDNKELAFGKYVITNV